MFIVRYVTFDHFSKLMTKFKMANASWYHSDHFLNFIKEDKLLFYIVLHPDLIIHAFPKKVF